MPQNVRNFWVTAEVSGYKHDVAFGPHSKDGEVYMNIFMYPDSDEPLLQISGYRNGDMVLLHVDWENIHDNIEHSIHHNENGSKIIFVSERP